MFKKSILLGTSTLMATAMALPAAAQDQDEIIVTATKRASTLQEVPVAVTVTSSDTIEKAQILDIKDLQSVVPSLRVTTLQTAAQTNFIIRGFGNGANNAGIEPSVGVFVDGVYRSRSAAQIGDLPKLERVEVLKGPQSILFGKNASAGVISVVSAAPSFDSEGHAELGYGNYNQLLARAYVTGPISDTVAYSLGGGYLNRDGYFKPAGAGNEGLKDSGDRDRFNLRGQLLIEPRDDITFRVIADYSNIDEICCGVTNLRNNGASAAVQILGGEFADQNDVFSYQNYEDRDSRNQVDDMGISFHADVDFDFATLTSISAYRENESSYTQGADFNNLDLLRDVREDRDIRTFTQELRLTSDTDGQVDWMIGGFYFNEDIDQVSGLEYGDQLQTFVNVQLQAATGLPNLLGTLEGLYGFGPNTFLGGGTTTNEPFTQYNSSVSAFGTLDFHVTDRLTLTGGLNYTKDDKEVTARTTNNDIFSSLDLVNRPTVLPGNPTLPQVFFGQFFQANTVPFNPPGGLAPTPANIALVEGAAPGTSAAIQAGVNALIAGIQGTQFQPQFLNFPNSVENGKTRDDKLTYTLRGAYEVNDSINVYASYATGFKSSSWNLSRDSRPFPADAAALAANGLLQNNQVFRTRFAGPEDARVIELGLKARFNGGNVNVAVFDQQIDGFQSNLFLGTGFTLLNAGKQITQGIEIDGSYRVFEPFTLTFAGTFLDAKYDEFTAAQGASQYIGNPNGTYTLTPTDLSGQKVSGVPEVSLSLGGNYDYALSDNIEGYLRADFQYESSTQISDGFSNTNFPDAASLDREVMTFNASTGVSFDNGISLQLWGRNLFNDEYVVSVFPGVAQSGVINGYPNQPRTYGVNARYNF